MARALTRRELWNGNRESFRNWLDPEHPIRWAWALSLRVPPADAGPARRPPRPDGGPPDLRAGRPRVAPDGRPPGRGLTPARRGPDARFPAVSRGAL